VKKKKPFIGQGGVRGVPTPPKKVGNKGEPQKKKAELAFVVCAKKNCQVWFFFKKVRPLEKKRAPMGFCVVPTCFRQGKPKKKKQKKEADQTEVVDPPNCLTGPKLVVGVNPRKKRRF